MNSTIMKVVAWIYTILGVIGSFVTGAKINDLLREGGAFITIIGIISTIFGAVILFAIAKILENTEYSAERIANLEKEIKRSTNAPEGTSNSRMSLSNIASKTSGNEWRCPKCGKTNPVSSRVCKDCAYQK